MIERQAEGRPDDGPPERDPIVSQDVVLLQTFAIHCIASTAAIYVILARTHASTDLIFVIFSPQMYFWAQFFSTWNGVNFA